MIFADALRNDLRRADTDGPLVINEWADVAADAA